MIHLDIHQRFILLNDVIIKEVKISKKGHYMNSTQIRLLKEVHNNGNNSLLKKIEKGLIRLSKFENETEFNVIVDKIKKYPITPLAWHFFNIINTGSESLPFYYEDEALIISMFLEEFRTRDIRNVSRKKKNIRELITYVYSVLDTFTVENLDVLNSRFIDRMDLVAYNFTECTYAQSSDLYDKDFLDSIVERIKSCNKDAVIEKLIRIDNIVKTAERVIEWRNSKFKTLFIRKKQIKTLESFELMDFLTEYERFLVEKAICSA